MHMVANTRRLDDAPLPYESVVPDLERMIARHALVQSGGGLERAARGDEGVAADGDGGVVLLLGDHGFAIFCGGGGWGEGAHVVPADADVGLDYCAAAEDDVLGAVEFGFAGYFVAGVGFDVVAFGLGGGFGRHRGLGSALVGRREVEDGDSDMGQDEGVLRISKSCSEASPRSQLQLVDHSLPQRFCFLVHSNRQTAQGCNESLNEYATKVG